MKRNNAQYYSSPRRLAITLTELLVVVGIIVLVLALSLPALSVWDSRKVQDAINLASGMLQSAQTAATTRNKSSGLFFYVEPTTHTQYIWPIEPAVDSANPDETADRYKLSDSAPFKLPKPMRAAPLSIIDENLPDELKWTWELLDNNDHRAIFPPLIRPPDGTQFHRNFFVILFDKQGKLITDQQVFIWDKNEGDWPPQEYNGEPEYPGFRTGLIVNDDPGNVENVVTAKNGTFIQFLTTGGILIYNDESYQATPDGVLESDARRDFLKQIAQPLYIHSSTGRIIKGRPEGPTS